MKKKKIILALFLGLFAFTSLSQITDNPPTLAINTTEYRTAIGLRAGETSGLTIKQFIGDRNALEAILGVWNRGFSATLLYERNTKAFTAPGLNWYYGMGGHVSFHSPDNVFYNYNNGRFERYESGAVGLGVDGIFGLEYKIPAAPIALSIDFKPYIEVITGGSVWMSIDPGIGIKLAF